LSDALLPDGLEALRKVLHLNDVMRLIEQTARWVDPETFRMLPIWYPEYARRVYFYKAKWSEPQMNKNKQTGHTEHKREGNIHANKSLTHALGLRSDDRPNWSCCHIWGLDDPLYQEANAVVQDRRFFSCVANMVLLPTPLKAFTDTMVEVKAMLRICARHLYGWHCDHESVAVAVSTMDRWADWNAYPKSWPRANKRSIPLGVMPITDRIRKDALKRISDIRYDLSNAGEFYPREQVRAALAYWKVVI
jgi:hypothetical protein